MKIEQLNKDTFKVSIETNIDSLPFYITELTRVEKTTRTKAATVALDTFTYTTPWIDPSTKPRRGRGPGKKKRKADGNSDYESRLLSLRKTGMYPSDIAKQLRKEGFVSARGLRLTGEIISTRLWHLNKRLASNTKTGPNGGVITTGYHTTHASHSAEHASK